MSLESRIMNFCFSFLTLNVLASFPFHMTTVCVYLNLCNTDVKTEPASYYVLTHNPLTIDANSDSLMNHAVN